MATGSDIAKAYVQIIPSAEGIQGKLTEIMGGEAESAGEQTGSKFGQFFGNALKAGGAIAAGFAAATAAITTTIINGTGAVAEYGDKIDKMSQKMGISAQAYQEWDAVLQHSGTSIDSMQRGMITLQKAAVNNTDAFEALGLSQEQIASMSTEDLFAATITGLQGMEEGAERTALASELLGGAAKELGPLLNTSAEETEAMKQRVHDLGGVMSDDAVKDAAAYQDSLQDMKTAFGGLKRGMMSDFMPSLSTVMDGLADLFSGNGGLDKINEGIKGFVDTIAQNAPKFMQIGTQLILSIATAITTNLPLLLSAAFDVIVQLGNGLIQNLPLIIQAGLQVVLSLATGIAESLPSLIPSIVSMAMQIVDVLTQPDTLSSLIDAAIAITMALANGLIEALPQLLERLPEIVQNVVDALIENAPKLLDAAYQLVVSLTSGIFSNLGLVWEKGKEIVTKLISGISQLYTTLTAKGKEILSKIGEGLKGAISTALTWGKSVVSKVVSGIKNALSSVKDAGLNIVKGIWQGISDGFTWIKTKITGWVGNVMAFIKRLFGIASPSTWARDTIGLNLAAGIGVGFEKGMGDVEDMMRRSIPTVGSLMGNMNFSGAAASGNLAPAYNYGGVTIQILGREKDADQLAVELQNALVRRAATWA